MEQLDPNEVPFQVFRQSESLDVDRRFTSEWESSTEATSLSSEPRQEALEMGRCYSTLEVIELRRQQLHNRHAILLSMHQFRNKNKESSSKTNEESEYFLSMRRAI